MVLNIKHPDLPFVVVGNKIRYPNGLEEPLKGDNLTLVQVFLLHQILTEWRKSNQPPEQHLQQQVKTK